MKFIRDIIGMLNGIRTELRIIAERMKLIRNTLSGEGDPNSKSRGMIGFLDEYSCGNIVHKHDIGDLFKKDYFTKELLSDEQVDLEKIHIIKGSSIDIQRCRSCNVPKTARVFDENIYFFEHEDEE